MTEQKKLNVLWIADAVMQTGFARVTHSILEHLYPLMNISVLAVNFNGDPTPYQKQYDLYPAMIGGDVWGAQRVPELIEKTKPDVILIINDPWNVAQYLDMIDPKLKIPVVAYMPVDAPNQMAGRAINGLSRAIAYTNFGRKQLMLGGYSGRCEVIPHGVNTNIYKPMPTQEARTALGLARKLPPDAFVVGAVARNQPRKRLDLTFQAWTQWWINAGQPRNAFLFLHTTMRDIGWNIGQLAEYYGMNEQLIVTNPKMTLHNCIPESKMPLVYNSFDVQLHTPLGEGWGLTAHEGMACRRAQIMPRHSAFAEWPEGCVRYVETMTSFPVTPNGINSIGAEASIPELVDAIEELYRNVELREELAQKGYERATEPRFNWAEISKQFYDVMLEAATERRQTPVGVKS
jgi:glycosyltransferase involved in cell wall biosynthesis